MQVSAAGIGIQLSLFVSSLCVSWIGCSFIDFAYPFWFEYLNINEFIQQMAPENRFKNGFELLTKVDYHDLFHQINRAVHFNPEALQHIQYLVPGTAESVTLLRQPEITHLKDVHLLLRILAIIGVLNAITFMILIKTKKDIKLYWSEFYLLSGGLILAGITIAVTQPVTLFYWLHELIFPENNQWFFYYQDSLMTTLMKAPHLFGPIAILIFIVGLMLHCFTFYFVRRRQRFGVQ